MNVTRLTLVYLSEVECTGRRPVHHTSEDVLSVCLSNTHERHQQLALLPGLFTIFTEHAE